MKYVSILVLIIAVIAIIFTFNSYKNKIIGTWYYESNPKSTITINKNNTAFESSDSETYNYTFEDKVLTFYSYGVFPEDSYYVEVKGDKMYWDEGDNVIVLYDSYEGALKGHEKQAEQVKKEYEEEQEHKEQEQKEFEDSLKSGMPDQGQAELYLGMMGYHNYKFRFSEEYLYKEALEGDLFEGISCPTVEYYFFVEVDGEEKKVIVSYFYEDFCWSSGEIEFVS